MATPLTARRCRWNAALMLVALGANAYAADGTYDQGRLWGIAILLAGLTANATAILILPALEQPRCTCSACKERAERDHQQPGRTP